MAALIGATATFVTALIQLLVNARRQAAERAAGKPASRKPGTWLAIFALMLAAAVGGYAFAQYQGYQDREDSKALRGEMQAQLRDLGNAAARLERAGLQRTELSQSDATLGLERRHGQEGVSAVVELPPCEAGGACSESAPMRAAICATVPAGVTVTEVLLFTRQEDSQQPWADAKVASGQDAGSARFIDNYFERVQADAREICQRFVHWGSQKGRSARIVVRYTP